MCSKEQLQKFLTNISENAEFPIFKYVSPENYTILLKCRVDINRNAEFYSEYTKTWIKKFSKYTRTGWIVRTCFPKMKRLIYRKVYVCHHASFNKTKTSEHTGGKDKQCRARIDFKVKIINRHTIKNDILLGEGLNLTIHINYTHSHRATESYRYMKCSDDMDNTFYKYFSDRHTVATAKSYHELTLLSNSVVNKEQLSNTAVNPTSHHLAYLLNKVKQKGDHNSDIVEIMSEKRQALEEHGGVLSWADDYSTIVVITPFMKNVLSGHELDCIIVDSIPIKECVVTFLLAPTPVGALPIACALHSEATESSFSQAFYRTKLHLESESLKSFEPRKFLINEMSEQNQALDAIFFNKTLLVSRASLVEEIWKTICVKVKIEMKDRHGLMELFNSMLHAENLQQAKLFYNELENNENIQSVPKLKEYLTEIWKHGEDYVSPSKVTDISLRLLRQFIKLRCNSYNNLIIIDVLVNILDNHWCEILHAHLTGKFIIETYTKFLRVDSSSKRQESKMNKKRHVTYRADTMCCDCVKGQRGTICEHLCAVLHSEIFAVSIPEEKRAFYMSLAGAQRMKVEPNVELEYEAQQNTECIEDTMSHENEDYIIVKQEMDESNDPLDNGHNDDRQNITCNTLDIESVKQRYMNGLKALNDEFRRLHKLFREHPSASNLETMGRLARELSKIRPVERSDLSNMFVEVEDSGKDMDSGYNKQLQ